MLFNSVHFLLFFPAVVAAYFALPHRVRWVWLLAASYYFYMAWRPPYVVILWAITVVDYLAGLLIGSTRTSGLRRLFLALSIASNLLLLFTFKYYDFFVDSLQAAFAAAGIVYVAPALDLVLPLGISFHTFQALSYTFDVYRGAKKPERHIGIFALYIAFFPQLVAGPIERATHLLPQFFERHGFDYARVVSGGRLMLWGFFKKVVIADRLAIYVNEVYNAPSEHSGARLALATYFFAYQIYCDFSGYSDIAIGAARVMGFEIAPNFRRPYHAATVREFWQRWHISLSTWFRDYLYFPLGGNRVGRWRQICNLTAVFLVSGLWHGANWTFVVWGGLHGLFVVASLVTVRARDRVAATALGVVSSRARTTLGVLLTFHLVALAWVFFRAGTLAEAAQILTAIATWADAGQPLALPQFGAVEIALSVLFVAALEAVHVTQARTDLGAAFAGWPAPARWVCYYSIALAILLFGKFDERAFIYFQF